MARKDKASRPLLSPARKDLGCWQLGPFQDRQQAANLIPRLPPGMESIGMVYTRVRVPNGYYVMIPALATHSEAEQLAQQLRYQGFLDSWVLGSGPFKNAISLGMFSQRENAERRLEELVSKGFEAKMRRRFKRIDGVLLRVRGPRGGAAERLLDRMVAGRKKHIHCPD